MAVGDLLKLPSLQLLGRACEICLAAATLLNCRADLYLVFRSSPTKAVRATLALATTLMPVALS